MKTLLRRISASALLGALLAGAPLFGAPPASVTITAPLNGANTGTLSSPANAVTITATAASSGVGATITQIDFRVNGTSVGVVNSPTFPASVNWTPTAPGTYTLTAIATDSSAASNNTLTSGAVTVTVPAVRLVGVAVPAANTTIASGSDIVIRATASMSDGVVGNVTFTLGGVPIGGTVTSAPYFSLATNVTAAPGTYNLVARATASDNVTTWDSVATYPITVVGQVGTEPAVSFVAPGVGDVIAVGNSVTVTASASDPDGFIPNSAPGGVAFYADGELIGTDFSAPYSLTWTPTVAKTVRLVAVVTDDKGNSRSTFRDVTVLAVAPTVSISSPANNSSATAGTPVTVNANAVAGVGTTIASVQFLADGVAIGAADTVAPYSVSWTPAASGTVVLTARVTDSNGTIVTSSPIAVNVAAAPGTLSATLTSPTNGANIPLSTTPTTLTATATAAGLATVTRVDFLVGTTIVGTSLTGPAYSAPWTPTTTGIFAVTVRVTDSNGATATSPITNVNVTGPSVAITAPTAGSTVALGTPVALNATATPVAPATLTKVDFYAGATLVGTSLGAGPAYAFNWTPTATGSVSLTARVTDSNGGVVTSAAVAVTVAASAPTVALTAPANGASVALGTVEPLTATATPSGGATISRVDFLVGTTVVGTALTFPYTVNWTPSAAGISAITARVTDSVGATATSAAINVNVVPPSATITSPANGAVLTTGATVPITATASAIGAATVSKVDFFVGTTLIGTDPTAPYQVDWVPAAAGNFSLTARVTDSNGATGTSTAVAVTVGASGVATVALTSPANGATVSLGAVTTLTATATASGANTVTRVDFLLGAGGAPQVIGTSLVPPYTLAWTPTTSGVATLSARVTDSGGITATSPAIAVTVGAAPALSVTLTMAGSTTIAAGSTRSLTATPTPATNVDRVELLYDGSVIATDTTSPYNFLFTVPDVVGLHGLVARVVDINGVSASSTPVTFTTIGATGVQPLITIGTPSSNTFLAPNVVTAISGTASDPDGVINSVQVFVNGALLGNATLTGSAWSINWTPTTSGVFSIGAVATDNSGNAIAAPAVGVTVGDATSPAITLSLSPVVGGVGASTTLPSGAVRNIVANVTPSSGRAIVRVEFFVDGTKVGEDAASPFTFRYVAPALAEGEQSRTYVLSARATDNAGSARDVLLPVLVVANIGQPPTVNLLTPANNASVFPNAAVSLAATAVATGGTITSVQFFVNGNPAGINGGNAITNAPYTTSFTPTAPGTYTIDAIATDDRGNTKVSNSATITAAFATPTVNITTPNPNATARATPNVPLNLAATATVQAGTGAAILLVEFLLDGVQIGADTTAPYTFSWTPTVAQLGAHVLTARVTDTNSQTSTSAPVNVNVATVVGTPPTVTISTTPIPGQGLQTLSQVNFIANAFANGTGSTLTSVEFFLNDVSIGLAAREQATNLYRLSYDFSRFDFATAPSVTDPNTGLTRYTPVPLYAIARDSNNNQTVSTISNLTINPSTSAPPSIQLAALSPNSISQGQQFFIFPQVTDTDGTVTTLQLYANGVVVSAIGNPQQGQILTYNANTAGRFNLFAVATDDTGNTVVSSPAIVVTVNPVNAPATTLTRPSDDSTATTVGAPVFLEGTATNNDTTQVPILQFIATASGGARTTITGVRVGTTNVYRQIWTPTTPDTYTVSTQATVGQAQGTSSVSRRVVVTNLVGLAPTVSISVPSPVTTASNVNFTATASDSDGSVIGVEFFLNRNSIGQAVRDQLTNAWRISAAMAGIQPGTAEVVALVRDSSGNVAASSTTNITVNAASSIAPSITITPSTTNAAFNRQIQLRSNARDTDGSVSFVQYFANNASIGTQFNSGTSFQQNWTPTASGTYNVWAVATDNTGNMSLAPTVQVVVRRNNPVLEDAAFILQTYQDIANTTTINPLVFDDLDAQLAAGTLSRADVVMSLVDETGFIPPVNLLAAYYVLMGQWPTPANYNTLIGTARGSLANAVGGILSSNEYFAKYGVVPTVALLNNPASAIPADTFIARLWQAAGLGTPSALANLQFRSNNVLTPTLGRGYNAAGVGINNAIAEFVTNTNSTNTALFKKARAAALYYQLARPSVSVTVEQITARIAELLLLPDEKAMADAMLKDILYGYRYVTITKHPTSLTVAPRSGVLFSVDAQGQPPLAYQWLLNGAPISGATSSMLSLTNVDATRVGTYTVTITSSAATATSDPATLTLSTTPTRLANISTRGVTAGGANVLIGGFVVTGANAQQTRQMLIRVVGPTLANAPFNVAGVLANPRLEVYAGNAPNPVLTNDDWTTQAGGAAQVTAIQQATARAAAFNLPNNSLDAAVLATLPPGPYTVQAKGPANNAAASGVVLIEVYDVTQGNVAGPKAANVSTRGNVGTGGNILIAGFVVNGAVSRRILIRGAGPTLSSLGVPGVLADPQLTLIDQSTGRTIKTNDDWASGEDAGIIATAASAAGAFPFASGSRDAAMIVMLAPGPYTVQLNGANNGTGVGIVEVYDVDP